MRTSSRGSLLQVFKTLVAAIVAWLVCNAVLAQPVPIFATIAALLVVQPSVNQSLAKGIERSLGVILGVVLAFAASLIFGSATWVVLVVILVSLLLAWSLRLTPGSANQIPISAMLVVALGGEAAFAADRVVETVIGAAVGLIVNIIIVPPVLLEPARDAVATLADGIADTLDDLADSLRNTRGSAELEAQLERARTLRDRRTDADKAVKAAVESLMLNPRGAKHRVALEHDREFLTSLSVLVNRVLGMTRAVRDHYDEGLSKDPIVRSIAVELTRAAHDLRLLAGRAVDDDTSGEAEPVTAELPALTAPLVIARPHPEHWILVGSLMEDLRRVREVITGESD